MSNSMTILTSVYADYSTAFKPWPACTGEASKGVGAHSIVVAVVLTNGTFISICT
jgi:hypothetical protein